jgi:hypothetical protein
MLKLTAFLLAVLVLSTAAASAADSNVPQRVTTTYSQLEISILDYYIVYGAWPASWQAVRDSGLFTAATATADGQAIDPDDNSLDFAGDIIYTYHGQAQPELTVWDTQNGQKFVAARHVPAIKASSATSPSDVDPVNLRLLATLSQDFLHFAVANGRLPNSWSEFIDSGVTPIDSRSVNPVTGQTYAGNGARGDFLFETRKNSSGRTEVQLQWMNLQGYAVSLTPGWLTMPDEGQSLNRTMLKVVP